MIGFLLACSFVGVFCVGTWFGWFARTYLDRRSRYYFRRGQHRDSDRSALSIDAEPLVDLDSIVDPQTRAGVRRLIEERNLNHVG